VLESGVDIRYIQELLGNNSSETTEIYTHISNRNLKEIYNPVDRIFAYNENKLTKGSYMQPNSNELIREGL